MTLQPSQNTYLRPEQKSLNVMVTNFEEITKDLTAEEKQLVTDICHILQTSHIGPRNAIKSPALVQKLTNLFTAGISQVKLRKYVNYIRSRSILPIIATSHGYYVSSDRNQIMDQIKSLEERANSINEAASGLRNYISTLELAS